MVSKEKRFVLHMVFASMMIFGAFTVPAVLLCIRYQDFNELAHIGTISISTLVIGFIGQKVFYYDVNRMNSRICFMTTIFTWLTMIFITSIPFYLSNLNLSYIDSLYEAVASWTTTGTSVVNSDVMPIGLKMLRASCNWMGALGIIVIALNFLPTWQFVGRSLVITEIAGPGFMKINTTFRKTYRRALAIYISLTAIQYALLRISGLNKSDSLITSLSNISTAGLMNLNNGNIVSYGLAVKIIITTFAFFSSLNFSILLLATMKKFRELTEGPELKFHAGRILTTTIFITGILYITYNRTFSSLKEFGNVLMQVISYFTTAGYQISDTNGWPGAACAIILIQMFIGACAISSGGGIKAARTIIALKTSSRTLYHHIHKNAIRPIKYAGTPLKLNTLLRCNLYIVMFVVTFLFGALILSINLDLNTALNTSLAMLTNTGTYINQTATPGIIDDYSIVSKITMMFLMLAGRLEIYPVILIFFKSFWKNDNDFL